MIRVAPAQARGPMTHTTRASPFMACTSGQRMPAVSAACAVRGSAILEQRAAGLALVPASTASRARITGTGCRQSLGDERAAGPAPAPRTARL